MKIFFKNVIRSTGLLPVVEKFREKISPFQNFFQNKKFIQEHPDYLLPPPNLAYDAYGGINWAFYYKSGPEIARKIISKLREYHECTSPNILEWGCGPGRIIRNLHAEFGSDINVFGSDYNSETIKWCQQNFPNIKFSTNELSPPLNYKNDSFNCVYAPSVFTHLSIKMNFAWMDEIKRVLVKNGIFIFSTMGDMVLPLLTKDERDTYHNEGILNKGQFKEGKKNYAAYHNPKFVKNKLIAGWELLEFVQEGFPAMKQDLWIVRKPLKNPSQPLHLP